MSEIVPSEPFALIFSELKAAAAQVREEEVQALEEAILEAQAVFLTGEGRSGLIARCLAMRLVHLGLRTHVVGDTATPAFRRGDLLIAISGTGETPVTCSLASSAASQGGRVAVVTAVAASTLDAAADISLHLFAAASSQFGGSLFEQMALLVFDAISLRLQSRLGQTNEQMQARHATLE